MPHLSCVGRGVALVAMSAIPVLPLSAQWSAPSSDTLRRIIADRIERGGSAGVVIGVIERGVPRLIAVGRRAGEGSSPLDGNTVFEIGSVSKVFTTTLLAELVVRGEVALDDPVQKYLPKSVRIPSLNGRAITLLDLATASSGLPRLPDDFTPADPNNPYADYSVEHMYKFLSSHVLRREPGAAYEYSNLGMGLLGHALASRAGMSYERLVTERILEPLGMTDTRIVLTTDMRSRLATGHAADLTPTGNWDISTLAGAGAWRSTANDMLRFLTANLSPPKGSLGEAIALAVAPRRPAGNPSLRIGLGWHVLEQDGRRLVWHNGETGGYHSFLGFDPVSGANVLVLSNSANDIDDIGLHVLDPAIPLRKIPAPRPVIAVSMDVLEQYVGRYELAPTFAIEITRARDALYAQATGQQRFRIFAATPTRFFLKVVEADIVFIADATGKVTGLVLHQNGREMPGRKVP